MKTHPVGAKLLNEDRQTDRQTDKLTDVTKLAVAIRKFAKAPTKRIIRPIASFSIIQLRRHIRIRSWISSNLIQSGNNTLWRGFQPVVNPVNSQDQTVKS
jgi:hypothetical protein